MPATGHSFAPTLPPVAMFIDGGYFWPLVRKDVGLEFDVNVRELGFHALSRCKALWPGRRVERPARVTYYDALPQEIDPPGGSQAGDDLLREAYRNRIELEPAVHLGFGSVRGGTRSGKPRRQKGVDTLIVVDMLEGAFTDVYGVALLIAGDADFVPVVRAVRRRGKQVVVAGGSRASKDLMRAADFFLDLETPELKVFYPLESSGPEALSLQGGK